MSRKEDDQEQWEWCQEWKRTHKRWIVQIQYHRRLSYPIKVRYFNKKWTAEVYAAWMRLWYDKVEIEQEK